ncbi:NAD(P)-binding protein [Synechococcus sp. MIT S9451]|uniref:NAD(P)-binding protein n=1 Tax=Synechococcus sp. MIT S9451 TaxID=3082543 RepID=UPI0039B43107
MTVVRDSPHLDVDLAVIGAGLAGTGLAASLRQRGFDGTILLLEAGRGPGGRAASRRRRDDSLWRLDHGAPCFSFSQPPQGLLAELWNPLIEKGIVQPDRGLVVGLSAAGSIVDPPDHPLLQGPRFRGVPTMASVPEALLKAAGSKTQGAFGERISSLRRQDGWWCLSGQRRARSLVVTGNLLAHPRSLAMLGWRDVPLRSAVPLHVDPCFDAALEQISEMRASVRWNLMLEFPRCSDHLPRQIWLTTEAQAKFGIERIVLHRQQDHRLGLVVHGLDDGSPITPASQPGLLVEQEARQRKALTELLLPWPELAQAVALARSLGVMRWGASQPLDAPLPNSLQWCEPSAVGFCGDWIAGPGFGMAEGALQSAVDLATQLI